MDTLAERQRDALIQKKRSASLYLDTVVIAERRVRQIGIAVLERGGIRGHLDGIFGRRQSFAL